MLIALVATYLIVGLPKVTLQDEESPARPVEATIPEGDLKSGNVTDRQTQFSDAGSESCLTLAQLDSHPLLIQDGYRFEALSDTGPVIESYRGLTESELLSLATQHDSAAMVVLGAMSIMRARDWPVDKAVPFLTSEDTDLRFYAYKRPLLPEFVAHTADAREWFYKAALHGRVLALYRVGDALSLEIGGAVELGWIGQEEYEDLSSFEKTALYPANVYNVLAYELAPELKSGPIGDIVNELVPRSERQIAIVGELAEQFNRDLESAGLERIIVPKSAAPPVDELMGLLCESERLRMIEEANNDR